MSDARDTLFRHITMLQLIPRYPGWISTPALKEKLAEHGFLVDIRSLQRDLGQKLSSQFPIGCDDSQINSLPIYTNSSVSISACCASL
ncbi:hypothetical protein RVM27_02765 [Halomonas sp. KM007]|jgi:hypothetical protein